MFQNFKIEKPRIGPENRQRGHEDNLNVACKIF